jgi:hypothetical protein
MSDPEFSKFIKLYKMKVPLLNIRINIRSLGKFNPDDILLFASKQDIANLKKLGDYAGTEY